MAGSSKNSTGMNSASLKVSRIIDNQDVSNIIRNIVDTDMYHQLLQERVCRQCRQNKSISSFCIDCKFALCDFCQNTHKEMKGFSNHVICPISVLFDESQLVQQTRQSVPKMCPDHPIQQIKAHCKTCKIAICSDCKLENHDIHQSESIKAALKRIKPHIKNQIRQIEKKKKQLNESRAKVDLKIDSNYQQILKCMQEARDLKIRQAEEDFRKLKAQLANHTSIKHGMVIQQNIAHSISRMDNVVERGNNLVAGGNDNEESEVLFELQNELKTEIETLAAKDDNLQNVHDFLDNIDNEVTFIPDESSTENMIGRILQCSSEESKENTNAAQAQVVKKPRKSRTKTRKSKVTHGQELVDLDQGDASPQSPHEVLSIIQYGRDFLLKRRYVPSSVEKSSALKRFRDVELVLDFPHQQGLEDPSEGFQCPTNYIKGSGKQVQKSEKNPPQSPPIKPLMDVSCTPTSLADDNVFLAQGPVGGKDQTSPSKQRKPHARSSSAGTTRKAPQQNQPNVDTRDCRIPGGNIKAGLLPTPAQQVVYNPSHISPAAMHVNTPLEYVNVNGRRLVSPVIYAPSHSSENFAIPNGLLGSPGVPYHNPASQMPRSVDQLDPSMFRALLQRNRRQ